MDTAIIQIGFAVATPVAVFAAIVWHRKKVRSLIDITEDIDWSAFEVEFGDAYFKHPAWRSSPLKPEDYASMDETLSTAKFSPITADEINCGAITAEKLDEEPSQEKK